ncbi:MAG: hypothetical protein V4714_08325 [Bacteroidota bacterium]
MATVAIAQVHQMGASISYQVDWFVFETRVQDVQWYVFDIGKKINTVIYCWLIWQLCKMDAEQITKVATDKAIRWFAFVFFLFELKEIPEYWLFANSGASWFDELALLGFAIFFIFKYPETTE